MTRANTAEQLQEIAAMIKRRGFVPQFRSDAGVCFHGAAYEAGLNPYFEADWWWPLLKVLHDEYKLPKRESLTEEALTKLNLSTEQAVRACYSAVVLTRDFECREGWSG